MDAAWASGIRYFDAARSYGKSEEFLRGWLKSRNVAPDQVAVGSKWGYRYTANWRIDTGGEPHEVKDHSAEHFAAQSVETLALLGEYINLYQIHSATLESGVLDDEKVVYHTLAREYSVPRRKSARSLTQDIWETLTHNRSFAHSRAALQGWAPPSTPVANTPSFASQRESPLTKWRRANSRFSLDPSTRF